MLGVEQLLLPELSLLIHLGQAAAATAAAEGQIGDEGSLEAVLLADVGALKREWDDGETGRDTEEETLGDGQSMLVRVSLVSREDN